MIKECQRVSRGQVWYIHDNNTNQKMYNYNDHVTAKNRPWLVVSNDINNLNSPTVNCVPISTGHDNLPCHAIFENAGLPQRVLCEQIKTFNVTDLKEYKYTVSKELMRRVDAALVIQFDLDLGIPSYDTLISLIEKIAEYKSKEIKSRYQQVTDEAILEIATRIEGLFAPPEVKEADVTRLADMVDVEKAQVSLKKSAEVKINTYHQTNSNNIKNTSSSSNTTEFKKPEKKERMKWTKEKCEEFLEDAKSLPMKEVLLKWNMSKKARFYSMKNYVQNLLTKMNQESKTQ